MIKIEHQNSYYSFVLEHNLISFNALLKSR